MQPGDGRRGRARRGQKGGPGSGKHIGQARFHHGGHIRQAGKALGAGNGNGAQSARYHMRAHGCGIQDADLHLALDHGGDGRGAAGEGDMRRLIPCALQEKLHAQLFGGPHAARAIGSPARFAL